MSSLKHCPCCGGRSSLTASESGEEDHILIRYQIICNKCGLRSATMFVSTSFLPQKVLEMEASYAREMLVERWNRREGEQLDPKYVGSLPLTAKMVRAALANFNPMLGGWTEMYNALMAALKVAREHKE